MESVLPWLPLYLAYDDLTLISNWLSADEDIALITSTGPSEWKAVSNFDITVTGKYCLYHKRSGGLPLLPKTGNSAPEIIQNPSDGWREQRSGANPNLPYFGAGTPSVFWFNVRMEENGVIGLSSFEWIGNHYSIIGNSAPELAKKWWNKLKRWSKKNAVRIPRSGAIEGAKPEIWTFRAAFKEIESGKGRAPNP